MYCNRVRSKHTYDSYDSYALLLLTLFINSSIRCPPIAVSMIPMGAVIPRSASSCAKYQQVAPMLKRL